jgi:hypothetical protein
MACRRRLSSLFSSEVQSDLAEVLNIFLILFPAQINREDHPLTNISRGKGQSSRGSMEKEKPR